MYLMKQKYLITEPIPITAISPGAGETVMNTAGNFLLSSSLCCSEGGR